MLTALRHVSIVGALMLVMTTAALAAPGANKSSSSISLIPLTSPAAADATAGPRYGDAVTFAVATDATAQPFVHLKCFQGGALVLESWQAWFFGAVGVQSLLLGPTPAWQGGAAECSAMLENWDSYSRNGRVSVLASTTFAVGA